jgi:hypothetical protein
MFSDKFMINALKEFGPPVLILAALFIVAKIGLLTVESMATTLSIGFFCGVMFIILISIMAYSQVIIKMLKQNKNMFKSDITDDVLEIKQKTSEFFELLVKQSSQSGQMHQIIMNIYDLVKGIPNKNLIFESLLIRTRYLLNDVLEIILDFEISSSTPTSSDKIIRRQLQLEKKFTKIKIDYVESIDKISRSVIELEESVEIDDTLEQFFTKVYDITTTGNLDIADILFKINNELKDTEDALKNIFKNLIHFTSAD